MAYELYDPAERVVKIPKFPVAYYPTLRNWLKVRDDLRDFSFSDSFEFAGSDPGDFGESEHIALRGAKSFRAAVEGGDPVFVRPR